MSKNQDGFDQIVGRLAHDAADTTTNFPIKVGGQATSALTATSFVAHGDVIHQRYDVAGHARVTDSHTDSFYTTSFFNVAASVASLLSSSASQQIYITDIIVSANTQGLITLQKNEGSQVPLIRFHVPSGGGVLNHAFKQPIRINNGSVFATTAMTDTAFYIGGYKATE